MNLRERRKKNQQNKRLRIIISVVLGLIILVCAGILIGRAVAQKKAQKEYDQLKDIAKTEEPKTDAESEPETDAEDEQEPTNHYEGIPTVDFEPLWEENTDICGWITVPGTAIDYPVLRNEASDDPHDAYYLDNNVDHSPGLPGAIYIEPCNSKEFTDFNTVIYGHNMGNGTMFAGLHDYEDEAFFAENEYVYVVTPEKSLVYQIFGLVNYDDRHIMASFDFSQESQRQDFLDSLRENSYGGNIFREGAEVTTEDRIVTLSTCIKEEPSRRLLVVAVLVDEIENQDEE